MLTSITGFNVVIEFVTHIACFFFIIKMIKSIVPAITRKNTKKLQNENESSTNMCIKQVRYQMYAYMLGSGGEYYSDKEKW
jgi:hypothetical protein